jgi:hypothetical protein
MAARDDLDSVNNAGARDDDTRQTIDPRLLELPGLFSHPATARRMPRDVPSLERAVGIAFDCVWFYLFCVLMLAFLASGVGAPAAAAEATWRLVDALLAQFEPAYFGRHLFIEGPSTFERPFRLRFC